MVPVHRVAYREVDGKIILLDPKFKNHFLKKHLLPRMKNPYMKIHLDEFGSWVWKHINNKNTVFKIGDILKEEYGKDVEPVYERLGLFINMLAQRCFISINKQPQNIQT